jgi:predicted nucleic acid-binding protein
VIVVADTSGLLAALDRTHPDGLAARRALDEAGTVIMSPVTLGEIDHVGRRLLGRQAANAAIDTIVRWARAGRLELPAVTADIVDSAQAVRRHYRGLGLDLADLDLADAVTVAVAEQFRTNVVLTLDRRDFRALTPLTRHHSFRLLPDDL